MSAVHLAWPTTGKRRSLGGSLLSLAKNAVAYGHRPHLLVACDSDSPNDVSKVEAELRRVSQHTGLRSSVSQLSDRSRFIESAPHELERRTLEYALTPDDRLRSLSQVGTNLNAILLATAGQNIISTDDDIYAKPATVAPVTGTEPRFSSSFLPAQVMSFADRESLMLSIREVNLDLVDSHFDLLGRSVRAKPDTVQGEVLTTTAGSYGDTGTGSARSFLLIDDERRRSYYSNVRDYETLKTSREVVRIPDRVYAGPGRHLMSMNIGLLNRRMLPPFLAVGRGSDGLFALLTRVIYPSSFTGFLDFGLLHDPEEQRIMGLEQVVGVNPTISDLLTALVVSMIPRKSVTDPTGRMETLGQSLFNLASSDLSDYTLFVHAEWSKAVVKYVEHLESLIERYNGEPEYWRRDVELHLDRLQEVLQEPTSIFGKQGCGLSPEMFAEQTRLFGRLLMCWPELWQWAKNDPDNRRGLVSSVT